MDYSLLSGLSKFDPSKNDIEIVKSIFGVDMDYLLPDEEVKWIGSSSFRLLFRIFSPKPTLVIFFMSCCLYFAISIMSNNFINPFGFISIIMFLLLFIFSIIVCGTQFGVIYIVTNYRIAHHSASNLKFFTRLNPKRLKARRGRYIFYDLGFLRSVEIKRLIFSNSGSISFRKSLFLNGAPRHVSNSSPISVHVINCISVYSNEIPLGYLNQMVGIRDIMKVAHVIKEHARKRKQDNQKFTSEYSEEIKL
ncbi:hypothetical protein [Xaviernesmea oryzae]|uniref:hypothetical protein n=1 Tax=Xaviernesmea oryzae TaxID=464029 RepID=UPI0008C09860|nr:hypothetical protein [Xaviernesmea oryzae]SEM40031.1 hypothetical protein SAMN04487976_1421 [Xaviernesmea oryzae]